MNHKLTGDIFNKLRPRNRVLADVFIADLILINFETALSKLISNSSLSFLPKVPGESHAEKFYHRLSELV